MIDDCYLKQDCKSFSSKLEAASKRPTNPIEFLGHHLLKVANEPPSPDESSKSISSASTPTPMD